MLIICVVCTCSISSQGPEKSPLHTAHSRRPSIEADEPCGCVLAGCGAGGGGGVAGLAMLELLATAAAAAATAAVAAHPSGDGVDDGRRLTSVPKI